MDKDLIIFAVAIWWRTKRPQSFSLEDHLKYPIVNCTTDSEKEMAKRFASLLIQAKEENKMGKKDKKDKKNKIEKAPKNTTIKETNKNGTRPTDEMIAAVTPAKIIYTIEKELKKDTTPAGDYNLRTPSGLVRARKSEGTGRVSWQLDNEQITRSLLYNITKSGLTKEQFMAKSDKDVKKANEAENGKSAEIKDKKDKKDKKNKKDKAGKDPIHNNSDGPDAAKLAATYKKKQLLNIIKDGQLFKKKMIAAVEAEITEKRLTGSEFIAALDTATGTETPVDKINAIFENL